MTIKSQIIKINQWILLITKISIIIIIIYQKMIKIYHKLIIINFSIVNLIILKSLMNNVAKISLNKIFKFKIMVFWKYIYL